jgi:hypothetical protein
MLLGIKHGDLFLIGKIIKIHSDFYYVQENNQEAKKENIIFECKIRECNGIRNNFVQENKHLVIKKSKWCAK